MADNEAEIILKGKFENGQLVIDATKSINKNLDQMGQSAQETEKKTNSLTDTLKRLAAIVGITALANQFKNLVKGALDAAGAMEQVDVALTTMLGSGEKAKKLTADLITFAKKTPFEIEGIFASTKQLLAYGVAAEDVIPTMNTLGNIAAGVGVDMNRLALAFGQVKTTGHLMGQDLNQFTQAGVPLLAALAQTLGKSEAEVQKLKESGSVTFAQVKTALESLTQEGGRFYNLMEKQSQTFLGTVSNMSDSFYQVKVALGDALLPVAKEVVNSMIQWFYDLKTIIENNKESITKFASAVVAGFSLIGSAIKITFNILMAFIDGLKILLNLPLVKEVLAAAAAILVFSKGMGILTIAVRLFTSTALGWVSIIIAATTALGYLSKGIDNMPDSVKIMALNSLKLFEMLKAGIYSFVEGVLDRLGVLADFPGFGWVKDAQKKFEDLKNSAVDNIEQINKEIESIKNPSIASDTSNNVTTTQTASPSLAAASPTAPDSSGDSGNKRLDAIKAENEAILEEQKNFLAGYGTNQTEADKALADNRTLTMQQKILQDEDYVAKKSELDQQLLNNEISVDTYKRELDAMNGQAKLEALQIQYEAELAKYQENQANMDQLELQMQATQDQAKLAELQAQYAQEEALAQQNKDKLIAIKLQLETTKQQDAKKTNDFQKIMDSDGYKAAQTVSNNLVNLQNSKHKELAAIGKAAAIFQITNDTARAAMGSFAALAPIPFVGPALATAAAAAAIAYGLERVSSVASNSFAVGTPNVPQDQLANIHKGEMIVPATFSEAIRSGQLTLGAGDAALGNEANSATITNININFEGAQFVGKMNDDDIENIGKRLGELIVEGVLPALPNRA